MKGGDYLKILPAGLPNITGYMTATGTSCISAGYGAFYRYAGVGYRTSDSSGSAIALGFDAARSNAIYGKAKTVQPPTLRLVPQFKF